ncbi:MAG: ParA family protein [Verrucomicrobia bacterium]|jgi:chromosome partitioning protein|nr:ParA family protein [Verrucomicrobiota bacterium]
MAAKIWAFLNFKGGVGKTTDTVNLAAILAKHPDFRGNRVLVIDQDPQCNATLWFLTRERYHVATSRNKSAYHLYEAQMRGSQVPIQDVITPVYRDPESGGGIDLVGASFDMLEQEEDPSLGGEAAKAATVIQRAIEPVRNAYDYILIDCPPGYSIFTRNALRAAQHVIVPYTADYLALEGIKWIKQLRDRFARGHADPNSVARIGGVIVNRYRAGFRASDAALAELRVVLDELGAQTGEKIHLFRPFIREATAVTAANNEQRALVDCEPTAVRRDFIRVAHDLVQTFRRHV